MKRLWIALVLLAAIFTGTLLHIRSLHGFTDTLGGLLEQADELAAAEDWTQARALTVQAKEAWADRDIYLHVLLRHADTDAIYAGFRETLALLEDPRPVEPGDVDIRFHVGAGYGIPGPEDTRAVERMARSEGIFFDPVYTGKAFAHFLQLLEEGYFDGEENILLLHSGGAGGLFAVPLPEEN